MIVKNTSPFFLIRIYIWKQIVAHKFEGRVSERGDSFQISTLDEFFPPPHKRQSKREQMDFFADYLLLPWKCVTYRTLRTYRSFSCPFGKYNRIRWCCCCHCSQQHVRATLNYFLIRKCKIAISTVVVSHCLRLEKKVQHSQKLRKTL